MFVQIFAFTDYPDFQALLEVECKEMTGHRPIIHHSLEDLKDMLEIFQLIDVLIIDEPDDHQKCHELEDFLMGQLSRFTRIFILGDKIKSQGNLRSYPRIDIARLFAELQAFVNPKNEEHNGWTAVPLSALVHFQVLPFDLFVKISNERFVKRVPAFEEVGSEVIENFKARGIRELYCERKHNRDFSMLLINNMINRVEKHYESQDQKLEANNEVFLTTKEIIQNLGLSTRVIEVCESTIERITQDIMLTKDQFGEYLRSLKNNPNLAFHFKLVELTSFICGQMVEEMNLSDKEDKLKRLVFASFFCDMTLSDPTYIHYRKAEEVQELSLDEHNEINFHALRASELVATYKNTPKEVSIIVRQHHGSFSGIGFPEQKSSELLPLSKILVISQDLAYDILSDGENSALVVLKNFVHKHQGTGLGELLTILEGSLGKNLSESA